MALSIFDDKTVQPTPDDITTALGRSSAAWWDLIEYIKTTYPPCEQTWSFGGAKWGWTSRLIQKKRTILYMTPCSKYFIVGFVLGERAFQATKTEDFPEDIRTILDEAPKYGEGYGIRIDIRTKKQLPPIHKLATIKMS